MTGDEEKRSTRSELENFVRDNMETLEELIRKEKEAAEDTYKRGKDRVRERVDRTKRETKNSARQTFNAFTDPKVQGHFMNAGFELIMGINSLVRSMPRPQFLRDEEGHDDYYDEYEDEEYYRPRRRPVYRDDDYDYDHRRARRPASRSIHIRTPEDDGSETEEETDSSEKK